MSGEWKGWKNWDAYLNAGVVENSLDFSEEPIIVDHAVGRTKNAIGMCWAMDAAVAYSLMKAGPNAQLTWSDLVNPYTRAAAVIMTRKVAFGRVPKPNVPSCGHDEFMGFKVVLRRPVLNESKNTLSFLSHGTMTQWMDDEEIPADHPARALCSFRTTKHIAMDVRHLLYSPALKPLLDLFQEKYPDASISTDASLIYTIKSYKGECAWKEDADKQCLHHDTPKMNMWALVRDGDDFMTAYSRESTYGGWNSNQWSERNINPKDTVSWDEVRRSMAANVPESEVIGYIKKSLLRMLKREDNIVSKEGRGKTALHSWSDWSWLAEMTSYVQKTNSKKRKEGEVANGWVYTKTRSRKSYGHEIADFVWVPQEEINDYILSRKEEDEWSVKSVLTNLRFPSQAQAQAFAESIMNAHVENGGFLANRVHVGFEKNESTDVKWGVRRINQSDRMVMHGTVDPEDYLSPNDLITLMRNAAPIVIDEHRKNFERLPSYNIGTQEEEVVAGQ